MATIAKKGQDKELVPPGTHIARCIKFIHFGHIKEVNFHGQEVYQDKIRITWELPYETRVFKEGEPEQPMAISKDYTNILSSKSNLYIDLVNWRGVPFTAEELAGFDVETIVGAACQLTIIHQTSKTGTKYEKVSAVSSLAKGTTCPPQVNASFIWNYNDRFDLKVLESMADWFQEKIKGSLEYKDKMNPAPDPDHVAPDIPAPDINDAPPEEIPNDLPF